MGHTVEVASPRRVHTAAACLAIALAGCGGDGGGVTNPPTGATGATGAPGETTADTTASPTTSVDVPDCETSGPEGEEIELIEAGTPVESQIEGRDQPPPDRRYFCVQIDDGASAVTVEVTATNDVDLFVAYGSFETLQGGGTAFWASDEFGVGDEQVRIEPGLSPDELGQLQPDEFVTPGAYYIEVSPADFEQSTPFTLEVGTE